MSLVSNLSMASGGRAVLHGSSKLSRVSRSHIQLKQAQRQQVYLAVRVQRINATIGELQPRTAALKDPEARKEIELRLKGMARHGLFVSETWRELDEILAEHRRAW